MSTLTIMAKGQVTLRKNLLQHLGVQPGNKLHVEKLPDGRVQVMATKPSGRVFDAFDMLKSKSTARLSIEEINTVAAQGWAGKF